MTGTDPAPQRPDFVALFPACPCGAEDCERCEGFQLTPRTAAALHHVAYVLADFAYDDVEQHGDAPTGDAGDWRVFRQYPRITWRQNAAWRRQAARAFDDLAHDLEAGSWPGPRSPGEEMALHLIIEHAQAAVDDGWARIDDQVDPATPAHRDDFDWRMCVEVFFQDTDILDLFEASTDGIEDPGEQLNQDIRMGDYRPAAWFTPFANAEPRDPGRGFRR